ncbi:MAG: hypothetical protein ACXWG1_08630 [Usitatibacter sp.]
MTEQENFECFGLPEYIRLEHDGSIPREPAGWSRRNWVHREAAMLGAEAIPSPPLVLVK